jgi:hypothetical protein
VAAVFRAQAALQAPRDRADTLNIVAILEEKRAETMAHQSAGYFIKDWHEVTDQVRQMIAKDLRYQAIKSSRSQKIEVE